MSYPYFHGPSGLFVVADGFVPVFQFLFSSSSSILFFVPLACRQPLSNKDTFLAPCCKTQLERFAAMLR